MLFRKDAQQRPSFFYPNQGLTMILNICNGILEDIQYMKWEN